MPNAKKDWNALIIMTLQSMLLGLGGWNIYTTHKLEVRLSVLEQWRGGQRAYTPEDARADMSSVERELEAMNTALRGHDRRLRELELMVARMEQ